MNLMGSRIFYELWLYVKESAVNRGYIEQLITLYN